MQVQVGEVVRVRQGRERGQLQVVLRSDHDFLFLVDGKHRTVEAPKKKRRKHVNSEGVLTQALTDRIRLGESVLDSEIRRALAVFRDRFRATKEV